MDRAEGGNRRQEKIWTLPFIMIFVNSLVVGSTQFAVLPNMSKYCMSLGATLKQASVVSTLMSMTAMFLRPISGVVVDRMNKKTMVMITTAANMVLAVVHTFANDIPFLAACRIMQGIIFAFSGVASIALSTRFIPESRLGEGLGWMALANVICQSIGPGIGEFLIEKVSFAACFYFCAVCNALSLVILFFVPFNEVLKPKAAEKLRFSSIISPWVLPYAAIMGLFSASSGLDNTFLKLMAEERGIANVSLFFTAYSLVMFVARPMSGKLLDRKGLSFTLYPALFCSASAAVLTGSAHSLWLLILAGVIKGMGQSAGSPGVQATCLRKLGKEKAGVVSSTCFIGQDLGNSLAPIVAGVVADSYGFRTMYWLFACILFFGGGLIYRIKSGYDRKHDAVPEPQQDSE